MPLPDDIAARIARGNQFEKRFLAWFLSGGTLGPDAKVLDVKLPSLDSLRIPKVSPRGRAARGQRTPIPADPQRERSGEEVMGVPDVVAIVDDGAERSVVIIELKSPDWSRMGARAVRRNVARHAAQMYSYQGHWTNQLWDPSRGERGAWRNDLEFQAIQMYVCYETRPLELGVAEAITEQLGEDGISVVWFDEIELDVG